MSEKASAKRMNKNAIYVLITIAVIVAYILIDGMGMFVNEYNLVSGSEAFANTRGSEIMQEADSAFIVRDMVFQQGCRIVYLILTLFPILFFALKYHISFKRDKSSDITRLIPYIRVFVGVMAFYYMLTLGTIFSHEVFTTYFSFVSWKSFFRIVGAFALLGASITDLPAIWTDIKKFPTSHPRLYKILFVLVMATCSCCVLEFQVGSKMEMLSVMLVFNILYWVILQVFIDLITRNVKIGAIVSLVVAYLIGLINDVVFQFRGNYVMYGDLTVVRTALEVAGNYTYKPDRWFFVALVLLIMSVVATILLKFPKHGKASAKEVGIRAGIVVAIVAAVGVTFANGMLYKNIMGIGWDYNRNVTHAGYVPYFLSNMNAIKKVTLDGYDVQVASDALDNAEVQDNTEDISSPNIIIIQNEAFADLAVVYDIETNRDYMPYIHSMSENTQKGYLNMSITGGPTANTEFEILMRSTMNFLPYGSVPYTQYIDADLPTVAEVLRNQPNPYYTVAYHSYYSSGYSRVRVYDHFGFDESVFEDNFRDDYPESDLVRELMSDSADYRRVIELYEDFRRESDAPWFCFNVTIQNHGGYTQEYYPSEENNIYVTNFEATDSINSYLSLISVSDGAFRELIEYFENCDEPTIIVMYGDHQPNLDEEASAILSQHVLENDNSSFCNFYVPYVIWANFDIEEEDYLGYEGHPAVMNTISTNYLASVVFDIAGVELSDYDRYLLDLHERIPALTALGLWDSEGNYYPSPASSPYADDLSTLEMIQYNLIFDDDNRLTDRFE